MKSTIVHEVFRYCYIKLNNSHIGRRDYFDVLFMSFCMLTWRLAKKENAVATFRLKDEGSRHGLACRWVN